MGARSLWPSIDRILGGRLVEVMRDYQRRGFKPEAISRHLYADHRIELSAETIRCWLRDHKDEMAA